MQAHEFDPQYLPSVTTTPAGHIDLMGIAPLEGTDLDLYLPVDYHREGSGALRLTHVQARHVVLILTNALRCAGAKLP